MVKNRDSSELAARNTPGKGQKMRDNRDATNRSRVYIVYDTG